MNLQKGDEIVILRFNSQDYIAVSETADAPFTLMPSNVGINPKVELYTMKEDEAVNTDVTSWIEFEDVEAHHINGGRPRNIVRR